MIWHQRWPRFERRCAGKTLTPSPFPIKNGEAEPEKTSKLASVLSLSPPFQMERGDSGTETSRRRSGPIPLAPFPEWKGGTGQAEKLWCCAVLSPLSRMEKGGRIFRRWPLVRSRRSEQVAAECCVADRHVADHVDQRRLARLERALERRNYLLVGLDLLAVTSHLGEDFVVTDVRQHVERIGAALQPRHLVEVRSP